MKETANEFLRASRRSFLGTGLAIGGIAAVTGSTTAAAAVRGMKVRARSQEAPFEVLITPL